MSVNMKSQQDEERRQEERDRSKPSGFIVGTMKMCVELTRRWMRDSPLAYSLTSAAQSGKGEPSGYEQRRMGGSTEVRNEVEQHLAAHYLVAVHVAYVLDIGLELEAIAGVVGDLHAPELATVD